MAPTVASSRMYSNMFFTFLLRMAPTLSMAKPH